MTNNKVTKKSVKKSELPFIEAQASIQEATRLAGIGKDDEAVKVFVQVFKELSKQTNNGKTNRDCLERAEFAVLKLWGRNLSNSSSADNYDLFGKHFHNLGLSARKSKSMLEGTLRLIQAIFGFGRLDGSGRLGIFLELQQYDLSNLPGSFLVFTFRLTSGNTYGRIVVDSSKNSLLDLADLYGCAWSMSLEKRKGIGFDEFWISHPDSSPLTPEEIANLEQEIQTDMYNDYYFEDNLHIYFDMAPDGTFMHVQLQEEENEHDNYDLYLLRFFKMRADLTSISEMCTSEFPQIGPAIDFQLL